MTCVEMELGEPDASGRRRPIAKPGSEFTLPVDTVIVAIGNSPNPLIPQTTPALATQKWGGKMCIRDRRSGFPGIRRARGCGSGSLRRGSFAI